MPRNIGTRHVSRKTFVSTVTNPNFKIFIAGIVAAAANAMNSTKYSGIPQQLRNIPAGMPQYQVDPRNRMNQQQGYRQGNHIMF